MSVSSCSVRRGTGSVTVLCQDSSMKTEWRGKTVRQPVLGTVALLVMMDRQVNMQCDNQVLEGCSGRGAEGRAGTQGLEWYPAPLWERASGK